MEQKTAKTTKPMDVMEIIPIVVLIVLTVYTAIAHHYLQKSREDRFAELIWEAYRQEQQDMEHELCNG